MNKLGRFYNQNRHIVWIIIAIVVGVIALIQVLDKLAYNKIQEENGISTETSRTNTTSKNYAIVTEQEIDEDKAEIIEEFINLCNNNQVDMAYEILSDDCKEVLYPTLDDFTEKYFSKIFETKKAYSCQAWINEKNSYTYRIDFIQDMLATGEPSKTSILDYYTVVKNSNNEYKLNINKFVGMKDINKSKTKDDITIKVLRKKIYMDYEIYDIEVINKTDDTIMIDDLQSTRNIYLEDNDGKKYYWYNYEKLEEEITVKKGYKQEIDIKFKKTYNTNNEIEKIVFSNIILKNKSTNLSIEI